MPTEPVELIISAFELSLLLAGAYLLFRLLTNPAKRTRWLGPRPLPFWPVTIPEFAIFVFLILGSGVFFQLAFQWLLAGPVARAPDSLALQVCLNGLALDGGGLVGWLLFRSMQKTWYLDAGLQPSPASSAPPLPWSKVWLYAGATLLMTMPVLVLVNLGWLFLLKKLGLPDEPQPLLAIFTNTRSPFVVAALLVVACGLAPLYEELLLRAGLYRFCRQSHLGSVAVVSAAMVGWAVYLLNEARLQLAHSEGRNAALSSFFAALIIGAAILFFKYASRSKFVERNKRPIALLLSSCLFGAMHLNVAGFVPLSLFGVVLALAYEATGSIRVAVVAHGLFNLNTVFLLLSGLPQQP